MTHVSCRLTAKNRDQLQNPTIGNRVWATITFFTRESARLHKKSAPQHYWWETSSYKSLELCWDSIGSRDRACVQRLRGKASWNWVIKQTAKIIYMTMMVFRHRSVQTSNFQTELNCTEVNLISIFHQNQTILSGTCKTNLNCLYAICNISKVPVCCTRIMDHTTLL